MLQERNVFVADFFLRISFFLVTIQMCFSASNIFVMTCTQIVANMLRLRLERQVYQVDNYVQRLLVPSFAELLPKESKYEMEWILTYFIRQSKDAPIILSSAIIYQTCLLLRVLFATKDTWFLTYVALTSVMAVMYTKEHKILIRNILLQIAVVVLFFALHYTPEHFCSTKYVLANCIWPQFVMYAGFIIISAHYMIAMGELNKVNKDLKESNKAKSDFLSVIGHEV